MNYQDLETRLFAPLTSVWLIALGGLVLIGLALGTRWLKAQSASQQTHLEFLRRSNEQIGVAHDHLRALADLKAQDVANFKEGFATLAKSRKQLFENGLSLQEERRLLEKQLEIMTTSLVINPALQRVFLMRADQPLQSYLLAYFPLRAFGGAPESLPATVRIVSKERFAHPERGTSEEVNGKLQYEPPQVGTSVRSNALGEFVIFTNSKLILHGPPLNPEDHEKFPHVCLGLDLDAARKLYRGTFIGTKITLATNP